MNDNRFKFRVWDSLINEYRKEGTIQLSGNGQPFIINGDMQPEDIDNVIIEQCTGLKDKNGKLIYEGDVLVFVNGATHPIIVTWNGIGWKFIRNGKRIEDAFECNTINHISMCEIIGNIHNTKLEQ